MEDWNHLLYLSGNDIPFREAGLNICQPRIKDIALLGEDSFYAGVEFLKFDKDILAIEDKTHLENKSNFEVLIAIMNEKNLTIQTQKLQVTMVLALLFPEHSIEIKRDCISLKKQGQEYQINDSNFENFKKILKHMFCLDGKDNGDDYNPSGRMAQQIAEKLKKRHQRISQEKEPNKKISILERYVSVLAVGEQKDINSLLDYTVYQLFDELKRYQLKVAWDLTLKARMAGAKDMKDAEDWMKDLHS